MGVVKGSGRNCQSISFLWPWETAPQVFCIFLASLLAFVRVYPQEIIKLFPVHEDFCFSHGLLIISLLLSLAIE